VVVSFIGERKRTVVPGEYYNINVNL
jgi:hypothetical protein